MIVRHLEQTDPTSQDDEDGEAVTYASRGMPTSGN